MAPLRRQCSGSFTPEIHTCCSSDDLARNSWSRPPNSGPRWHTLVPPNANKTVSGWIPLHRRTLTWRPRLSSTACRFSPDIVYDAPGLTVVQPFGESKYVYCTFVIPKEALRVSRMHTITCSINDGMRLDVDESMRDIAPSDFTDAFA